MPELSNINVVREILGRHGFKFSKSFGQNFIVNPDLCPRIAEESGVGPGICALEIGPGMGVLTKELALRAEKVLSIEIDKALLPVLKETLGEFDNVTILNADVLELDLKAVIKEHFGDMPFVVCANLPYYITTPIIMSLLESGVKFKTITVLVQKEVAQRMAAKENTKEYGALTCAVQFYTKASLCSKIPASCFYPAPKVDSQVIRLERLEKPLVDVKDEETFFKTVKAAFAMRRKTLANNLIAGFNISRETAENIIEEHFMTIIKPEICGNKVILSTEDERQVCLQCTNDSVKINVEERMITDTKLKNEWGNVMYRIT